MDERAHAVAAYPRMSGECTQPFDERLTIILAATVRPRPLERERERGGGKEQTKEGGREGGERKRMRERESGNFSERNPITMI